MHTQTTTLTRSFRVLCGLMLVAALLLSGNAGAQVITEFPTSNSNFSNTSGVAASADGNVWFIEGYDSESYFPVGDAIGRMTPFGIAVKAYVGAYVSAITAGPDGNLWFTGQLSNSSEIHIVGRVTLQGVVTRLALSTNAGSITAGPDGNLWFTEPAVDRIGRVTLAGVVTEFGAGISAGAGLAGIAAGPDGNLWFTENAGDRIGRITPAGIVTEFTAGITTGSGPAGIAAGPDGNLWFTESAGNRIGRITPAGVVTEFGVGIAPGSNPASIAAGQDDNLWFTEYSGNRIGRITPAGLITEFSEGISAGAGPDAITLGPDGNLWFAEYRYNQLGHINIGHRVGAGDVVWVDDSVPQALLGAGGGDDWVWVSSNPTPYSGTRAHQSALTAGFHHHSFIVTTETLDVGVGDDLFVYVYLDPANPPSEVMLQWNDGTWEHRAYWGANLIGLGSDGTTSRRYMGVLPPAGQWARLYVPAALVGLEGRTLYGMNFGLYDGRATWDYAAKSTGWVQDGVPAGASVWSDGGDYWNWVPTNPAPFSGSYAHQSALASGFHQHYFYGAAVTQTVDVGDTLFTYVYLDSVNPPRELMLQWNDGNWEHRAYWGANVIGLGVDGTVSRRYRGPLPPTGRWVRLAVPAAELGLEGHTLNGIAFSLYDGLATWDFASKSSAWVQDAAPGGASLWSDGGDSWYWVTNDPTPYSGALAHQSGVTVGYQQHYFYNASATLAVGVGDTLFTYVYLDPANPPSEVMLQWNDGSWEHRAYWGANVVPFGTDGSASRRYMGPLPANGQWARLAVPAADVGLEGNTLNGMAFSLYGGRATFDYASTSPAWVQDALPAGAATWSDGGDTWNWVSSNPSPYSGTYAHQSAIAAGYHQHLFYGAADTLAVGVGDTLFTYIYLDPANPPSEVMLQWFDGSWEHRAYWGPNLIGLGIDGTVSRRYMGPLPAAGQWVRLTVPASQLGLDGKTVNGMAFTLWDGRATWDFSGR